MSRCIQCGKELKSGQEFKEFFCSEQCRDDYWLVENNTQSNEPYITCPYCGYVNQDSWEEHMEDGDCDKHYECPNCGREFEVSMEIEVSYSSTPKLDVLKQYLEEENVNE